MGDFYVFVLTGLTKGRPEGLYYVSEDFASDDRALVAGYRAQYREYYADEIRKGTALVRLVRQLPDDAEEPAIWNRLLGGVA